MANTRRRWPPGTRAFALTFVFNVITIAVLSATANTGRTRLIWIAVPFVVGFNGWLHRRLQPYRISARKSVMGLSALLLAAGLAMAGAWMAWGWPNSIGYLGLIATCFGLGQVLMTLRYDEAWVRRGLPRLVFLACSGAKAEHLYRRAQYAGEPIGNSEGGLDQLSAWRRTRDRLG